ncbi:MAG: branched-chain amino acid ABC transporter permease [Chthonomonadaceae bacterium]|nr:branched-chain amino acid ABC transporter permease [Chthonomonadaceae bacterium]
MIELFLNKLILGIQLGGVYALVAVGYTIVYGVLQFINFAHGDVYMVGAFMGMFVVKGFSEGSISSPVAMVVVLGMILIVAFFVSMRGHWKDPKGAAVRLVGFAVAFALIGTLVKLFLKGGVLLFKPITALAATNVIIGGIVALTVAVAWCAGLGVLIERTAYKPVRGTGRLTALITAIGVSLLIENGGQAVFGSDIHAYSLKDLPGGKQLLTGTLDLNLVGITLSVSKGQLIVLLATTALVLALTYIVRYTKFGKAMRAVAFDRDAAALMGINTDTIIAFTFLLGSGLAGAAGFLNFGLTGYTFDTNTGIMFGLKAFVAAVLGGIGNLYGAVLGGLVLGLAEMFVGGSPFSPYRDAIAFIILIAILLFRPSGLLGKNTVEKV